MLTKEQIAWMQTYHIAPIAAISFYKNLVATGTTPFTTQGDLIGYDEVKKVTSDAKILPRGMEFPIGKQDGFEKKAVAPDIIKHSIPFTDADGLEYAPGQVYLGGQVLNNKDKKRNERIQKIKLNIERKANDIAAEMLFNQTYTPDEGAKITFSKAVGESIAWSEIKKFSMWAMEKESAYQKENQVYPDLRFIGTKIYRKLVEEAEGKNSQISVTKIGSEKLAGVELQYIILDAKKYYVLPQAQTAKKTAIDTSDLLMFYSHNAIIPGYAGVTNVVNGKAMREEIDVLVRETSANEKTGSAETLGESGYIPILVAPKLIWKIKVTGIDAVVN